jgi:hypothetical protein
MKNQLTRFVLPTLALSVLLTSVALAKPERRARDGLRDVSFVSPDEWPARFDMYVIARSDHAATLPAGLILTDDSREHQKLVVAREVALGPGDAARVPVFCLDRDRIFPDPGTALHTDGRARGLVARILSADPSATSEIRQRAIWVARGAREEGLDENGAAHREISALLAQARRHR